MSVTDQLAGQIPLITMAGVTVKYTDAMIPKYPKATKRRKRRKSRK